MNNFGTKYFHLESGRTYQVMGRGNSEALISWLDSYLKGDKMLANVHIHGTCLPSQHQLLCPRVHHANS